MSAAMQQSRTINGTYRVFPILQRIDEQQTTSLKKDVFQSEIEFRPDPLLQKNKEIGRVNFTTSFNEISPRSTLERAEFGEMVEAELPGLRRYAVALLRSGPDADDLVQETVARALDKHELWQPGTNLRAWLFTMMHNLRINGARSRRREGFAISPEIATGLSLPATQVGQLTLRDLKRALDALEEGHRAVVLLVGLEGLSYEDVADILELPLGTVRSRLSRARVRLRRLLEGEEAA
jgi:RNA polymerase sigma-70 factor (ECF subfamily)